MEHFTYDIISKVLKYICKNTIYKKAAIHLADDGEGKHKDKTNLTLHVLSFVRIRMVNISARQVSISNTHPTSVIT